MRLIDYLKGRHFVLASDLPPEEVARRLDDAIESMWEPFATGVIGWVALGRFALRYRDSIWLQKVHLPVLAGRMRAEGGGSRITLSYRAPRFIQLLFVLLPLLLLYIAAATATYVPALPWPMIPILAVGTLVAASSPLVLISETDDILKELLAVVEEAAGRTD